MAALTLPADAAIARVRAGRRHRVRRRILAMSIMSVLVVVLFGAMLMLGNTIYPLSDVLAVLSGQQVPGASFAVGTLRLPRALTAILAGFAFGVAGTLERLGILHPVGVFGVHFVAGLRTRVYRRLARFLGPLVVLPWQAGSCFPGREVVVVVGVCPHLYSVL